MSNVKEIITDVNELYDRSEEVDLRKNNEETRNIVLELKDTVEANKLSGLSAPQIGYKKRLFCINFEGKIRTYINPVIYQVKGLELSIEKCSSIPGKRYLRIRNNDIGVIYQTPLGKTESVRIVGKTAIMFQHYIDHLDGMLLSDVGLEIDDNFDTMTDEEKNEVFDMYLKSLDLMSKQVEKAIEEDKDSKQLNDAAKFISKVNSGEVKLVAKEDIEKEIKDG